MKRMFLIAMLLIAANTLYAAPGDLFSTGQNEEFRISGDGEPIILKGEPNHETFIDVVAVSTSCIRNSDNYAKVSTATLVASGTTWTTVNFSTQPDYGRTISLVLYSSVTAGGAGGWTSSCTWTVDGICSTGTIVHEVVLSTANALVYTNYAYVSVSTVTLFISSMSRVGVLLTTYSQLFSSFSAVDALIGLGNKIGLCRPIAWSNDVYKVKESKGHIALTDSGLLINCTYYTIDFHTEPDGIMDYDVVYKARKRN